MPRPEQGLSECCPSAAVTTVATMTPLGSGWSLVGLGMSASARVALVSKCPPPLAPRKPY